ncbi:MAG: hypothetical protein IT220_09650 [Flavobacteriaceae bacterium]|nr:hypothetical protein [Flavobacteriaceae bacterium]
MKKFVLISALFFLFQSILLAQNNFPKSWVGSYRGQLHLYTIDSIAMRVDMKLDIVQTMNDSIFQWKMTYIFNGNEDVRDYQLKLVDASKGHYIVDERNSILIDTYYRNGVLTSFFEVEKSFIISEYTKIGEEIHFDIISGINQPILSGNSEQKGELIPEVMSFPINGRQEAVLIKI